MFRFFFLARTNAHWHSIVVVIAFLATIYCLVPSIVASSESDSKSLLKLKESFLNADALLNWNISPSPCHGDDTVWTGLRCENGSVTIIRLEGLGLSGKIDVNALDGIPTLRSISFMNNNFSGPMPNFGKLGSLRGIFLSNNQFSGEIPIDQFVGMELLKKVWLSGNKFSGPIPVTLAAVPRLLELRLEQNQLTGEIPDFSSANLTMFNVSYNALEGEIPASLIHMDVTSFEGNKALCGPPLQNICPPKTKNPSSILILTETAIALIVLFVVVAVVTMLSNRDKAPQLGNKSSYSSRKGKDSSYRFQKVISVTEGSKINCSLSGNHRKSSMTRQTSSISRQCSSITKESAETNDLVFVVDDRQRFELQDLLRASAEVLGTGSFGSSYKAVLVDGTPMVVKRYKEMNSLGRETFHEYMRKLGRLRHPNISTIVAYFYKKDEKLMVSEYARNGSLLHRLHGNHTSTVAPLDWPTRLNIVKGVARGLAYLYTELPHLVIPHGHIKSSNVLLNDDYEPLLTDFALAPVLSVQKAAQLMVSYRSPECLAGGAPTKKSDVWSLGVLILEILTGKIPISHYRDAQGGMDLPGWVNSMLREEWTGEVFDREMGDTKGGNNEMLKLLQIGLACCEDDVQSRWEMREALARIDGIEEGEGELMSEEDGSSNGDRDSHASREDGGHDHDG